MRFVVAWCAFLLVNHRVAPELSAETLKFVERVYFGAGLIVVATFVFEMGRSFVLSRMRGEPISPPPKIFWMFGLLAVAALLPMFLIAWLA